MSNFINLSVVNKSIVNKVFKIANNFTYHHILIYLFIIFRVTELLDLVQPPYLTTTTIAPAKRLDQIEAKLNSLMNMINHKLP